MRKKEAIDINEEKADRFIRKKMMEAAESYEQELNNDPALQGLEASPQVFENIMAEIRKIESAAQEEAPPHSGTPEEEVSCTAMPDVEELLSEEDRMALEIGRKHLQYRGRRRILRAFGVAAALLAIIFGISMVSEANRIRLMSAFNNLVGKEGIVRLGNEEDRMIVSVDEREARELIRERLGIIPVDFMYRPDGMEFMGYSLDEQMEMGVLFYQYGDTILSVHILNKEKASSFGMAQDGKVSETIMAETSVGKVEILETEGAGENEYYTEFFYKNGYYIIYGILTREEFVKMIEKILII